MFIIWYICAFSEMCIKWYIIVCFSKQQSYAVLTIIYCIWYNCAFSEMSIIWYIWEFSEMSIIWYIYVFGEISIIWYIFCVFQSNEWIRVRIQQMEPDLMEVGSTLEEALQLRREHDELLMKLNVSNTTSLYRIWTLNPFNAEATFVQTTRMQRFLKNI